LVFLNRGFGHFEQSNSVARRAVLTIFGETFQGNHQKRLLFGNLVGGNLRKYGLPILEGLLKDLIGLLPLKI
jgi:hypothetical protein